jgi:adenosylcobinamide-GDP ribazoletransferase
MGPPALKGFVAATTFLTRVGPGAQVTEAKDVARGVPWFPIVGGLIGAVMAALYAGLDPFLPPLVSATLVVGFGVWVTGAIHEDGLADTADAFGGVRSTEDARRILKDPTLGSYGVAALVFSLILRIGALAALDTSSAFMLLPVVHATSRAGAIGLLGFGRTAADEGLGATYASGVRRAQVIAAAGAGIAIGAIVVGPLVGLMVAGVGIGCMVVGLIAHRRIGGVTGDVLGAAEQVSELIALLIGVALVGRGRLDLSWPWWSAVGAN